MNPPFLVGPCVAVLLLASALPVAAQARDRTDVGVVQAAPIDPLSVPRPSLRALRIVEPIAVDGHLDEGAWASVEPTERRWIQITPDPGMPATEHTVVRVLYDDTRLYIGAVLYDSDPEHLSIPGLEQDFDTPSSDMFGIAIDSYHDRQNGFVFAINPAGAVWDAQTFNDSRDIVPAWEGIVDIRTSVNDSSWIVEAEIPFATLRFKPVAGEQVWGINFTRRLRRRNEDSMWAPVPQQYRVYRFSLAGTLEGLTDLPRSRNLWIKPYALGERLSGVSAADPGSSGDVGLDVKWGLTSRMTLDLTANTDFSQVEVDAEQVNLTRFSLFFPEKRDFFLENEGTFAFQDVGLRNFRTGSSPRSFRLFHSRRIGLSESREPIPILGGARLTGRVGDRFEVGFLDTQTRSVNGTARASENFAVGRVKAQLSGGSSVGAMFVNRQETGVGVGPSEYNRAYGVDAQLYLFGDLALSSYLARTDERIPLGSDRNAGMVQAAWRSAVLDVSTLYKQIGDGFNPGVGFVDRSAVRRYFVTLGGHPKIRRAGILEVNPHIDVDVFTNLDGALETRTLTGGLELLMNDGSTLGLTYDDRHERLFVDTPIAGALVPAGTYEWGEPSLSFRSAGSRALSGSVALAMGDFYGGTRTSISSTVRVRPNPHVELEAGLDHNDLRLGGSRRTADLYNLRLRLARDTRSFFLLFVQYNELDDELITNARVNIIHAPLSDIFLVYTERRVLGAASAVIERGLTLKVTKLFAL
ncbi:MAG: carbohydrate binding family 9 domain-containing protein [Gemmatimonadota bacterium]|nr:carbohydrate binding family 9 domain-containing protein [Gemmatimonadota bacterium]